MAQYKVIGNRAVGGVQPGEVVELDPAVINVAVLLGKRITELPAEPVRQDEPPTPSKPAKPPKAKPGEGE